MAGNHEKEDVDLKFKALYDKCNSAVYKNIFKLVKDEQITEDLFQEVFILLYENLTTLDPSRSIEGWLFVVSYHKALAFLKMKVKESITYVENYDEYLSVELPDEEAPGKMEEQAAILAEALDCCLRGKNRLLLWYVIRINL